MKLIDRICKAFGIERKQKGGLWAESLPIGSYSWWDKGEYGESLVAKKLAKGTQGKYILLQNVYVPYKGKTTEIDLLMIHEKSIFVFESKNYGGWIFGSADGLDWTQSMKGGQKYKFYNPIKQNETHIKALSEYLELPTEHFNSYVVFSDRCRLMNIPENTASITITYCSQLKSIMRHMMKPSPILFNEEEIIALGNKLLPLTNRTPEEKAHHVSDLNNKCPYCGSDLVVRNGKNGQFLGCSAYPKCKYTRNLGGIGTR